MPKRNTSSLFGWNQPELPQRIELLFESRNKEYGAYILRKEYSSRIRSSLLFMITFTILAVSIFFISAYYKSKFVSTIRPISNEITMIELPLIDKNIEPLPIELIKPPPLAKTIKFTPPKVVRDEEAREELPPTQDETVKSQVGAVTQEGTGKLELPNENPVISNPDEDKLFTVVEEMPTFPGGYEKYNEFIVKHVVYPTHAKENGITGKVFIGFIVDKDGKIKNVNLKKGIGGGCDEEAMRVVSSMPDWIPGKENGMRVKVNMLIHIDFKLQ